MSLLDLLKVTYALVSLLYYNRYREPCYYCVTTILMPFRHTTKKISNQRIFHNYTGFNYVLMKGWSINFDGEGGLILYRLYNIRIY